MSTVTNRLIKGSIWISAARVIINLLTALSTIVLARMLTPADFGLVAIGTTMLALLSAVTDLSLSEALVRHRDPGESHFNAAWTLNAARGLLIFAIFAAIAYPTAYFYNDGRLTGVMIALGFSIFISGLTNPRRIMLQRDLVFWQEFVLTVSQKLGGVLVAIVVAVVYKSYWALVAGAVATQLVNVAVSYMSLPFRPKLTIRHMRELMSFSLWLTAGQVINQLNWRFDQLLLGKLLGKVPLGYYTVGSQLALLPTREMTAPLTQTIYPGFSKVADSPERLAAAYQRAQALVTAVALPAGIGAAALADPLVRLTMGEKWLPAVFIIQALGAVYALQTLGSLVQPLGMAQGQTRIFFIRNTQLFFMRVPIIVAGMYLDGLRGVIVARIVTGVVSTIVNMRLVTRFTGLGLASQLAANARSLISVVVMAGAVLMATNSLGLGKNELDLMIKLAVGVITGAIVYCGTSIALWQLMRRPSGPETEILQIVAKLAGKMPFARKLA